MTLQPPYIVVIPHELRTILYLRIPEMGPKSGKGLALPMLPAAEAIEHQLLKQELEGLVHGVFWVLGTFTPAAWRSTNLAYLRITRDSGRNYDIMIEFPKYCLPAPPRVTRQARKYFGRNHPRRAVFMNDDTLFTIFHPRHPHPSSFAIDGNQCTIRSFHYITRRGNFVKPVEKNFRIDVPDWMWNPFSDPGTLCGVSGVAVLAPLEVIARGRPATLALIRFQ